MGRTLLRAFPAFGLFAAFGCQDQGVRVTGGPDTTLDDPQSETAIAASSTLDFAPSVVVAYNDDTDNEANGYIEYTSSARTIHPGASLMGWSYSLDQGQSFTYGGKVAPPLEQGWWAIWSDPAITTQTSEPENSNVFMGYLAISFRPFLASGGTLSGFVNGEVDGACVARSGDGGLTFGQAECFNHPTCHKCILCPGGFGDSNGQSCLSDDDCSGLGEYQYCKGDFYDGGSMTGTATGQVFYAVHDVPAGTPHVWRSSISSPQFALLDLPFPDSQNFVMHPRVRYDQYRGRVYIAQQYSFDVDTSALAATYFEDGVWAPPTFNIMPGSLNVPIGPTVTTANGPMRTANQFSFDVGETEVRFFFNTRNPENGNLSLRIVSCTPELTGCQVAYAWGQTPQGPVADRFNPLIRVEPNEPGFGERWALQYQTTQFDPGGTIAILRAVLDSPTAPLTPLTAVPSRVLAACAGHSTTDSSLGGGGMGPGGAGGVVSDAMEESAQSGGMGGVLDADHADADAQADVDGDAQVIDPESCDYPVKGIHACCNGKLCRGQCNPKTGECYCGAISGGCWVPTVCCGSVCASEKLCGN